MPALIQNHISIKRKVAKQAKYHQLEVHKGKSIMSLSHIVNLMHRSSRLALNAKQKIALIKQYNRAYSKKS